MISSPPYATHSKAATNTQRQSAMIPLFLVLIIVIAVVFIVSEMARW